MIRVERLTQIEKVLELINEQTYDKEIGRYRSSYLYRGMPNVSYYLTTSLHMNCREKYKDLEKSILRNFTKYAANEEPLFEESVWRQLIIGQHHGLPTRLQDWTYSPLIGLHFATSGEPLSMMEHHDSVLWRIDMEELNALLPEVYRKKLTEEKSYLFTVDMLHSLVKDLDSYDADMNDSAMVLLEPPSIDQRIINQYSYFAIIPNGISNIEQFLSDRTAHTVKYIIAKELRWKIRDMLDRMNINERLIYPGLDGLSAWLKRHYYVKKKTDIKADNKLEKREGISKKDTVEKTE